MLGFLRKWLGQTDSPPSPANTTPTALPAPAAAPALPTISLAGRSFVRREALLNRREAIAGYEFSLHQGLSKRLSEGRPEARRAYDEVVIGNLAQLGLNGLPGKRLAFVGIAPATLDSPHLASLPAATTVLMLDAADLGEGTTLPALITAAKAQGFRFGWRTASSGEARLDPALLALCDFAQLSTPACDGLQIADWVRRLRQASAGQALALIAADIETADDFQVCFRAGFDYFHGPFVSRRENWHPPQGRVDLGRVSLVLQQLRGGADNAQLAATVRLDPVVTYKLLRYLNAPINGLAKPVTSIEQCLMLLGRDRFYRWFSLLLFDVQKVGYAERHLCEQALVRAGLMERLGRRLGGVDPDQLFLTGLFSLLDKLMDRELGEVLANVAVPEPVAAALLHDSGPYHPLLQLARACEQGVQNDISDRATACGLDMTAVNHDMLAALVWAGEMSEVDQAAGPAG